MTRTRIIVAAIALVTIGTLGYFGYKAMTNRSTTAEQQNPPANPPTNNPPAPANNTPASGTPTANPPAGAPPAPANAPLPAITTAPAPIPRAIDALGDLIEDLHWYKENGKGDFLVSSQVPPFHIQVTAEFFKEADQDIFRKEAEEEINRTNLGRTVTELTSVRFTLDQTSSRFESALILFEGLDANGNALNAQNQTSAVRVVLDSNVWTMQRSVAVARQIRQALHDTLGPPDRGEVRQRPVLIYRDPLLLLSSE